MLDRLFSNSEIVRLVFHDLQCSYNYVVTLSSDRYELCKSFEADAVKQQFQRGNNLRVTLQINRSNYSESTRFDLRSSGIGQIIMYRTRNGINLNNSTIPQFHLPMPRLRQPRQLYGSLNCLKFN